MRIYAAIDTNVLVSALLDAESVPGRVVRHALTGLIIPILNEELLVEYEDVLSRRKFPFTASDVQTLLDGLVERGEFFSYDAVDETFSDEDDIIFYAVTMDARKQHDAYLVTGNIKHFPLKPYVVTPREMLEIIDRIQLG